MAYLNFDDIKQFMPAYLTDGEQVSLLRNITKCYPNIDYYSPRNTQEMLQGDGWTGFEIITFDTMQKISVSGLILSNTCDIAPENPRMQPPNIVFALIINAGAFEAELREDCTDTNRINNYMGSIRSQAVSNRFYLPKAPNMRSDYVVLLDNIHTIPREYYLKNVNRKIHIRLSNAGFYVFILKLSIHFCRLADKVNRNADPPMTTD